MGDIIIPKKTLGSFLLGVIVTTGVILGIGAALAATVFNAGGGTIANLAAPVANTDAATKAYVDAMNSSINGQSCDSTSGCTATCSTGTVIISAVKSSAVSPWDGMTENDECWGASSCTIGNVGLGSETVDILCSR